MSNDAPDDAERALLPPDLGSSPSASRGRSGTAASGLTPQPPAATHCRDVGLAIGCRHGPADAQDLALTGTALEAMELVIKGAFNPAIFSPAWLLGEAIIGGKEYGDTDISLITRDLAGFRTGWLRCDVTPEACQLSTSEPEEYERLRDAAVAVLRALPKTPIAALGINRVVHLPVDSVDLWHAVGDRLAPKGLWDDLLVAPGMRTVTVWGVRPDGFTGRVQVQVEPSFRVPRAVFVSVNDHFSLSRAAGDVSTAESREQAWKIGDEAEVEISASKSNIAIEILTEHWQASLTRAAAYVERVQSLGLGK